MIDGHLIKDFMVRKRIWVALIAAWIVIWLLAFNVIGHCADRDAFDG